MNLGGTKVLKDSNINSLDQWITEYIIRVEIKQDK